MKKNWVTAKGIVIEGYRVASGTGKDQRYPAGTLNMQKPHFAKRGLDLSEYFEGTINLDISPAQFALIKPVYTFKNMEWTHLHPPESFSFSRCFARFNGAEYGGWVYTPHPETKAAHFHSPSILEIVTHFIPGLKYGDTVEFRINPEEIALQLVPV